jgi:hypothetical protein
MPFRLTHSVPRNQRGENYWLTRDDAIKPSTTEQFWRALDLSAISAPSLVQKQNYALGKAAALTQAEGESLVVYDQPNAKK